jgi:hypothetical protein
VLQDRLVLLALPDLLVFSVEQVLTTHLVTQQQMLILGLDDYGLTMQT